MAPKSRSLPSDAARSSKAQKLCFINHKVRQYRAQLEAEMEWEEYSKLQNETNKPQKKTVNRLREKLAGGNTPDPTKPCTSRLVDQDEDEYEIKITPMLNQPIFYTGSKIEGEKREPIKVTLYKNGEKETSGPLASSQLEIFAINGFFCERGEDNWSYQEFDSNIVEEREEVGLLLSAPIFKLVKGEATLDDLVFRDNSSWVRTKTFRIGVRILNNGNVRVKEGITEPFRVKDRHGKATEKPRAPKLEDGVERLKGVGGKRMSELRRNKVCTVEDFLRLFYMDESRLLKILDIKSNLHESWKAMIKHAKMCEVGQLMYSYCVDQRVTVFFTSVYELVGVQIGGRYKRIDNDTDSKKVNKWKEEFYKRAKHLKLDFKMGKNGPMSLENDSSEVSSPMDLHAENSFENDSLEVSLPINLITVDAEEDKATEPYENILTNQASEESSNLVSSLSNFNFGEQMVEGDDSGFSGENQVSSSVPESSQNNSPENEILQGSVIIETIDDSEYWASIWSELSPLREATFIDNPANKQWIKLRGPVIAACMIIIQARRRKLVRSASQSGQN